MTRSLVATVLVLTLTGCASDTATSAPTPTVPSITGSAVTFPAEDGVTLQGRVFGRGTTAVVLSNMGDNDPGPWQTFAPLLAQRGYLVLSYSFRYPMRTNRFTEAMALGTVPDLLGAIAYVRGLGATRVVLIGASLGGIAVGKVAGAAGAAAVVVLSSPQNLPEYGLVVTPTELAAMTAPKLFIASEQDTNARFDDTRAYFANAPEPKQFHTFPGGVHGVLIFATGDGDELRQLLLTFVTANAPA
jgi:pimeloyl-ACP methyl ester carboxylesterase